MSEMLHPKLPELRKFSQSALPQNINKKSLHNHDFWTMELKEENITEISDRKFKPTDSRFSSFVHPKVGDLSRITMTQVALFPPFVACCVSSPPPALHQAAVKSQICSSLVGPS